MSRIADAQGSSPLWRYAAEAAREGRERRDALLAGRVAGTLDTPAPEPRPVPSRRAPRGKSATAQVEDLAGLLAERAEKIQATAVAEIRHYLGAELAALAAAPADQIEALQYDGEHAAVTAAYRAGLLLAARLVADPGYEY